MAELVDLLTRWHRLRTLGLVPQILQEGDQMWTFTDPVDPWGSKAELSLIGLERTGIEAEREADRQEL